MRTIKFIGGMLFMFFLWILAWMLYVFWCAFDCIIAVIKTVLAIMRRQKPRGFRDYLMRDEIRREYLGK